MTEEKVEISQAEYNGLKTELDYLRTEKERLTITIEKQKNELLIREGENNAYRIILHKFITPLKPKAGGR